MVYNLYNLTYEEVKIIDPKIEQMISKEEYLSAEVTTKMEALVKADEKFEIK